MINGSNKTSYRSHVFITKVGCWHETQLTTKTQVQHSSICPKIAREVRITATKIRTITLQRVLVDSLMLDLI